MRLAETVTFGGGGLARHSELRGDTVAIAHLAGRGDASAVAIWRGKILIEGDDPVAVVRLPLASEVFGHADEAPVFLGKVDAAPVFARDISGWQPHGAAEPDAGFFDTSQVVYPGLAAGCRFGDLREVMARLTALDAELAASAKALFGWHSGHGFCAKCGQQTAMSMAAGSGIVRPAAPIIFRAPIRW